MLRILIKIHKYLAKKIRKETVFSKCVEDDLAWLATLPEPIDLVDASYLQYLCHKRKINALLFFLLNMFSFFLYQIFLRIHFRKPDYITKSNLSFYLQSEQYLPVVNDVKLIKDYGKFYLSEENKNKFKEDVAKYENDYLFKLKLLIKAGIYEYYIESFRPEIIYCSSEYSYSSSYLTLFCNRYGILHCNVQHGEKLLNISNSFFSFNKMYIWDEEYVSLFKHLRCNTKSFIVFTPPVLKLNCADIKPIYDFKYYLQNQKDSDLEKIANVMKRLESNGFKVAIRMHPAYSNKSFEKKYCDMIERNKDIAQSVGETKQVISQYSTVLLQCTKIGKGAIIDDVTSPQLYVNLSKVGFILLKKDIPRLSIILKEFCK